MGKQPIADILTLLRECENADEGVLVERRTGELGYDPPSARYTVDPTLTLDYDSSQVHGLAATDDDQLTVNRWKITRTGGSFAVFEETSGPLGSDPDEGVGLFAKEDTLNLETDDQCLDHAAWRVHLGTVNEYRYPQVGIRVHAPALAAKRDDIASVDVSKRIVITDPTSTVTPNDIDLVVEGYEETFNSFEWTIVFNCTPYSPWRIAVVGDDADSQEVPRVGSGTATLASAIDSDDTSLSVTTGTGGLWTTASGDFPMDINIGGERIRLSAISGTSSPQTFTVSSRAVNGVNKTHASGASVEVWEIAQVGL